MASCYYGDVAGNILSRKNTVSQSTSSKALAPCYHGDIAGNIHIDKNHSRSIHKLADAGLMLPW